MFKRTYPYICDKCGYFHWEKKSRCEGCGSRRTIRKTNKKDWKNYYIGKSSEIKSILVQGKSS